MKCFAVVAPMSLKNSQTRRSSAEIRRNKERVPRGTLLVFYLLSTAISMSPQDLISASSANAESRSKTSAEGGSLNSAPTITTSPKSRVSAPQGMGVPDHVVTANVDPSVSRRLGEPKATKTFPETSGVSACLRPTSVIAPTRIEGQVNSSSSGCRLLQDGGLQAAASAPDS